MANTDLKIVKFSAGVIRFSKTRKDGDGLEISVEILVYPVEMLGEDTSTCGYTLGPMRISIYGIPGAPEVISSYNRVTVGDTDFTGTNKNGDKVVFVDPDREIVEKVKFLLDPLSTVMEDWGIQPGDKLADEE